MNCRRFQDQLYEYVEGSLSASARAVSEEHLADCPACREAVRREQIWSQALSSHLGQPAARLKLAPETRHDILAAMRREPAHSPRMPFVREWWTRFPAPLTLGAAAIVLGMVLWLNHSSNPPKPGAGSGPHASRGVPATVSVDLANRVQICQFRREGDKVIDRLSVQVVGTSITLHPLPENLPARRSLSPK